MSTRTILALARLLLTALVVACAPLDDEAPDTVTSDIIRGRPDRGRNPGVVALLTARGTLCSGALIGPRLVLTARHCVSLVTPEIRCPSRDEHVLLDLPPSSIGLVTAEDSRGAPIVARGERAITSPSRNLCGNDLALLVLDREVRGIAPLVVDTRALPDVGDRVTIAGYGRRGDSRSAGLGLRYTRSGVAVVRGSRVDFATGEGPCNGDSGSPAIDPQTGRVVGVLSRGTPRCVGPLATAVFTRAWAARLLLDQAP